MLSYLNSFLKNLNGWKYVIGILLASIGQWYDIKSDLKVLQTNNATIIKRDDSQDEQIRNVAKDIHDEIKGLREDLKDHTYYEHGIGTRPRTRRVQ